MALRKLVQKFAAKNVAEEDLARLKTFCKGRADTTFPAPPTNGQARAGQLIGRATDSKATVNDPRALMLRFLADGPASGKARAGESGPS